MRVHTVGHIIFLSLVIGAPYACQPSSSPDRKPSQKANPEHSPSRELNLKGFLSDEATDKPSNLEKITKDKLAVMINTHPIFFPPETDSGCYSKAIGELPFETKDKWLITEGKSDATRCNPQATKSEIQIFRALRWEDTTNEISSFEDKKVKHLAEGKLQEITNKTTVQSYFEWQITSSLKVNGKIIRETRLGTQSAIDGGPCLPVGYSAGNCEMKTVTTTDDPTRLNIYSKVTYQNVVMKPRAEHFDSGTIAFEINDWKGTVTYRGKNTKPTWTAKNGAESASGTLTNQVKKEKNQEVDDEKSDADD